VAVAQESASAKAHLCFDEAGGLLMKQRIWVPLVAVGLAALILVPTTFAVGEPGTTIYARLGTNRFPAGQGAADASLTFNGERDVVLRIQITGPAGTVNAVRVYVDGTCTNPGEWVINRTPDAGFNGPFLTVNSNSGVNTIQVNEFDVDRIRSELAGNPNETFALMVARLINGVNYRTCTTFQATPFPPFTTSTTTTAPTTTTAATTSNTTRFTTLTVTSTIGSQTFTFTVTQPVTTTGTATTGTTTLSTRTSTGFSTGSSVQTVTLSTAQSTVTVPATATTTFPVTITSTGLSTGTSAFTTISGTVTSTGTTTFTTPVTQTITSTQTQTLGGGTVTLGTGTTYTTTSLFTTPVTTVTLVL
jgi:hypothetical protein